MKKLLILTLVLGIASLASAGFSIAYDGANVIVSSDVELIGGINLGVGGIGVDVGTLELRTVGAPTTAPVITEYGDTTGIGYDWTDLVTVVWGDPVTTPNPAGMWLTAPVSGVGTVELVDGNFTVLGSVEIPEPATMALLGLGALFLRRRK